MDDWAKCNGLFKLDSATIIGGLFGEWIPDPHTYGMDYALPAMFIGLFVLQLISSKPKLGNSSYCCNCSDYNCVRFTLIYAR